MYQRNLIVGESGSNAGVLGGTLLPDLAHDDRAAQARHQGATRTRTNPLRPLLALGALSLVGWLAAYLLFFSRTMWDNPSLIADRWPAFFYRLQSYMPWEWLVAEPNTAIGLMTVFGWAALVLLMSGLWLLACHVAGRLPDAPWVRRNGLRIVLVGLVLFCLLGVFSLGLTSSDIYSYIWYGKMAAIYGASPFTHAPSEYANLDPDNWISWVYWRDQPAVYGPVWVMLASALAYISQAIDGNIVTHLLSHRISAALFHIANTVLVWRVSGLLFPLMNGASATVENSDAAPQDRFAGARLAATIFYGWCPLMIWEFANNAHNDVFMIFWVLLALFAHLHGAQQERTTGKKNSWWLVAFGLLTMAVLVKVIAILLLPAYVIYLFGGWSLRGDWCGRIKIAASALAVFLVIGAVTYAPYWEGPKTIAAMINAPGNKQYINSIGGILRMQGPEIIHAGAVALHLTPLPPVTAPQGVGQAVPQASSSSGPAPWTVEAIGNDIDAPIRNVLMLIAATLIIIATFRVRDLRSLLNNWGWILISYMLVGAIWFWPWYISWLLPIAALAGPGRLRNAAALYASAGLLLYCFL